MRKRGSIANVVSFELDQTGGFGGLDQASAKSVRRKQVLIRLAPADHRRLKVLAAQSGVTMQALLERAVARIVEESDSAQSQPLQP